MPSPEFNVVVLLFKKNTCEVQEGCIFQCQEKCQETY